MRQLVKLKDIASHSKGSQINGDELIEGAKYDYLNGGINPSGKWNESNCEAGTIAISEGGNSCGYVNYMREPFWCGAHCYYLYDTVKNTQYLYYALKSQQEQIMKLRSGACMPNIKKSDLGNFEFMFDNNEVEQEKITSILSKLEKIIEAHREELQSFDELVKARFVELFGNPLSNSKGLQLQRLSKCLESIDNGKSFICENEARRDSWPAVLKLSAATYGVYKPNENKAVKSKDDFVKSAEVHEGDLLFTRKNTPELVGMCAYVASTPEKLMMPDLIFRLNTMPKCNKIFLWQLINHDLFRPAIINLSSGSAKSMSNISKERLMNLQIIMPDTKTQNQFADFVNQVDKSKVAIQKSIDETQLLFDSLMQQYF
jgi:type I restriction enzyme S subunit